MFQGRLFISLSLFSSLLLPFSLWHVQQLHAHLLCHYFLWHVPQRASLPPSPSCPLPPLQWKNISSAKINCLGLAWACSKQIYLVPRFMSLHYETYTHPDRPLPPPFFLLGPLSIACCGTFGRAIKQVAARRTRQYELDIFIVVAAVVVFQMNI